MGPVRAVLGPKRRMFSRLALAIGANACQRGLLLDSSAHHEHDGGVDHGDERVTRHHRGGVVAAQPVGFDAKRLAVEPFDDLLSPFDRIVIAGDAERHAHEISGTLLGRHDCLKRMEHTACDSSEPQWSERLRPLGPARVQRHAG